MPISNGRRRHGVATEGRGARTTTAPRSAYLEKLAERVVVLIGRVGAADHVADFHRHVRAVPRRLQRISLRAPASSSVEYNALVKFTWWYRAEILSHDQKQTARWITINNAGKHHQIRRELEETTKRRIISSSLHLFFVVVAIVYFDHSVQALCPMVAFLHVGSSTNEGLRALTASLLVAAPCVGLRYLKDLAEVPRADDLSHLQPRTKERDKCLQPCGQRRVVARNVSYPNVVARDGEVRD